MKTPKIKRKIQTAIEDTVLQLDNLLALAHQQGYLIEMRTTESIENGKQTGRVTLAHPKENFVPRVQFKLYLAVYRDEAELDILTNTDNEIVENDH